MSVICTHNAGFFSCCAVKLTDLVYYMNSKSQMPQYVDSSKQFSWYKNDETGQRDITYEYFEHYDNITDAVITFPINYHWEHQFIDYSNLDYNKLKPIIKKYFSPAKNIITIVENMEQKYGLLYENICVLFYRGNDKVTETNLCNYDEYLTYANSVMEKNSNILFLIQTDETEFIEFMSFHFPRNSFYFNDEIRHIKKQNSTVDFIMKDKNYEFSKYYLAITIIMSKCKYIVCGSGNCSEWIMFYRGNNNNVYQNLNGKWYTPTTK